MNGEAKWNTGAEVAPRTRGDGRDLVSYTLIFDGAIGESFDR